ncbi:hypothetical protein [Paenibacillus segetis]|nr:hypothetical protein [Paenibacillus segetis]
MGKDFARFTAEVAKGISIKETSVEVKLQIPLKEAQKHLVFLSQSQGEKLHVYLGDPQASFDFDEDKENDPMYQKHTGRWTTADSSGVVTKVEEKEEDENQAKLFDQESGQRVEDNQDSADKVESESSEDSTDGNVDVLNPEDQQDGSDIGEDIPDWMREGAGDQEMSFTDEEGSNPLDNDNSDTGEGTGDDVDISKEQLEEFILQKRPSFPDVDLDFPSFVEKRRDGATWLGLSKELGIPSSQLNTKFKKYKDQVKKLMKDNGAA